MQVKKRGIVCYTKKSFREKTPKRERFIIALLTGPKWKQPRYNAETEVAMQEARDIMSGKKKAKSYSSADELFMVTDTKRDLYFNTQTRTAFVLLEMQLE